jgi:hypothetical protein
MALCQRYWTSSDDGSTRSLPGKEMALVARCLYSTQIEVDEHLLTRL